MRMDRIALRVALLALAVFLLGVAWRAIPYVEAMLLRPDAEPRVIAARGSLAQEEQATIAIFEASRGSVVSVSTAERVLDPFTRAAVDVPRGTGSGFVWDKNGHIVTNSHVIRGASELRLVDSHSLGAARCRSSLAKFKPLHDSSRRLLSKVLGAIAVNFQELE